MKRIIAILLGALCGFCCFACSKVKKSATYEITYSLVVNGEVQREIPDHLKKPDGVYPSEYTAGNGDVLNVEIIQPIDRLVETYEDTTLGEMTFQGWFLDKACTKPFKGISNITAGKLELYGKYYVKPTYEITYSLVVNGEVLGEIPDYLKNPDGVYPAKYTVGDGDDLNVEIIQTVDKLVETYEDTMLGTMIFRGWFLDETCLIPFKGISNITVGDITLYGKYQTEHTKDITYYVVINGEKKDLSALPKQMLVDVSLPSDCEEWAELDVDDFNDYLGKNEKYEFQGWYIDENCEQAFDISKIDGDSLELYAKFKRESWKTITYYAVVDEWKKDLSALPEQMRSGVSLPSDCEDWAELEVGDLEGYLGVTEEYKFLGWYMDEKCTQTLDLSKVEGDSLVLYAKIDYEVWTKFY